MLFPHIAKRPQYDPNILVLAQVTSSRVQNEFWSDEAPRWPVVLWGVLGTILSHILLFLLIPETLLVTAAAESNVRWQEFDIILDEEEEPDDFKQYVPVNKEDLDNKPDETDFFGSQNTQAANEELTEDLNETTPFVDGESEEFNNVVRGDPIQVPPSPPVPPSVASNADPRRQQDPSQPRIQIIRPMTRDELDQQRSTAPVAFEEESLEEEGPRSLLEVPEEMKDEDEDEFVQSEREDEEDTTRNRNEAVQQETPLRPLVTPSPQPNPEDRPGKTSSAQGKIFPFRTIEAALVGSLTLGEFCQLFGRIQRVWRIPGSYVRNY